jgi:uncharacterized protein YkwD
MKRILTTSLGAVAGGTVFLVTLSVLGIIGPIPFFQWHSAVRPSQAVERFITEIAKPGTTTRYELKFSPSSHYDTEKTPVKPSLAGSLASHYGMVYSAGLAQAANEVAYFYEQTRRLAPSAVLAFFLDAGGAPYWGVRQTVLITTENGEAPINELLNDIMNRDELEQHVGMGEYRSEVDPSIRVLVLLSAQKTFTLSAIPRRIAADSKHVFRGRLESGYTKPAVLAMGPSGEIESLDVQVDDTGFVFEFSRKSGDWIVEIVANGPMGPIPLAQLNLVVDDPLQKVCTHTWPGDEESLIDPGAYLTTLINQSRRKAGLKPLRRVNALDKVAEYHSQDMRVHGFVGHYSPRTGMIEHRLERIAYPRYTYGENVALNGSIADAHEGLMASLGHRSNLLSPNYSELGVGLRRNEHGWYITQIFSAPGPVVSAKTSKVPSLAKN